jgi:hypothetical protein
MAKKKVAVVAGNPDAEGYERNSEDLSNLTPSSEKLISPARQAYNAKMGKQIVKPPRYTVQQVEDALYQALGNVSIAATLLQCERMTVYNYINQYPDRLSGIREKCRRDFVDIAEGHLIVATRGGKEWAVRDTLRAFGKLIGFNPDGANVQNAIQNNVVVQFVSSDDHKLNGGGNGHG